MAIVTILEAFIGKVICKEIEAWLMHASPYLLRSAVSKLPAEEQERYEKEWTADLEDFPSDLSKLVYALGLLKAAWVIRRVANQHKDLVRAWPRKTRGKEEFVIKRDEKISKTTHVWEGQIITITVNNETIDAVLGQLLLSCGYKVWIAVEQ